MGKPVVIRSYGFVIVARTGCVVRQDHSHYDSKCFRNLAMIQATTIARRQNTTTKNIKIELSLG
jgi:hypothetical protein